MLPAVDPIVSPVNPANSSPESTLDDDPPITPATTTQFDHSESLKSPFRAYPSLDGFSRSRPTHRRIMSMTERLDEDAIMDDDEEAADSMENHEMESRDGWSLKKGQTVEYPMDSKRDPCSPSPSRPSLVHRQSSYSKRHASLDTPREVPFPFPLLSHQSDLPGPRVHHSVTAPHETSPSQPPQNILPCSELQQQQQQQSPPQEHPPFHRSSSQPTTDVIDAAGLIASDRPPAYQKVDEHRPGPGLGAPLANFAPAPQPSSHPPIPLLTPSSSPLIMDPVNTPDLPLPAGSSAAPPRPDASITSPAAVTGSGVAAAAPSVATVATPIFPFGRPVSSPSATTPPTLPPSRLQPADPTAPHWYDRTSTASLPLPTHTPLHTLPSLRTRQTPEPIAEAVPTPTLAPPQQQSLPIPPPPPATGRAQPVPRPLSSSVSSISHHMAPPPPYSVHTGSGMGRSTADYSPVVPARVRAAAASPTAASHSLPPPAPPTILGPPTPSAGTAHRAAHESFLSDAPPPPDSWIAVETFPREYNLVVRLPGFRRDAITLATRRRRILHLVADSWEANGGHFERRISFGYDADLTQVRAEFDGELLRVVVPRRMPGVTWYGDVRE